MLTLRLLDVKVDRRNQWCERHYFLVFVLFSFALQTKYHQIFATSTWEYKMCQTDAFRAWTASSAHFCSFEIVHQINILRINLFFFFFVLFFFNFKFFFLSHTQFSFRFKEEINDIFVYLKSVTINVIDMIINLNNFKRKLKFYNCIKNFILIYHKGKCCCCFLINSLSDWIIIYRNDVWLFEVN